MTKPENLNRKPRILLIGHAQHGKDDTAQIITEEMGVNFSSSSHFVATEFIWPFWGKDRYGNYDAFFEDRKNNRKLWADMVETYNTPDATKTASTMLDRGNHMYVGMRRRRELVACKEKGVFDTVIWVDACDRKPLEDESSMELNHMDAEFFIDNNPEKNFTENIRRQVQHIQKALYQRGFNVKYAERVAKDHPIVRHEELAMIAVPEKTMFDMPDGATQVLDHGFLHLQEVMGSDKSIADSARMSYGRGTKSVNNDQGLINYLMRHKHTSPLEMGEIKFHARVPIFIARQWIRHRTANLNEYSGRYSEMVRLFYVPKPEQICHQDRLNKQGSAEPLSIGEAREVQEEIKRVSNYCFDRYEFLLNTKKVSRETARMVLPLNTYTEFVWKLDISNLIKFLFLRDDEHAQWEIRQYAGIIGEQVQFHFPFVHAAYMQAKRSSTLSPEQIHTLLYPNCLTDPQNGLSKSETAEVIKLLDMYDISRPDLGD